MSDVNCPYCGADQEINHDDGYGYEEDSIHQQECVECDKTFTYTTSISFSYDVNKADCLNGSPHEWKAIASHPAYPLERCQTCGESRRGEVKP